MFWHPKDSLELIKELIKERHDKLALKELCARVATESFTYILNVPVDIRHRLEAVFCSPGKGLQFFVRSMFFVSVWFDTAGIHLDVFHLQIASQSKLFKKARRDFDREQSAGLKRATYGCGTVDSPRDGEDRQGEDDIVSKATVDNVRRREKLLTSVHSS